MSRTGKYLEKESTLVVTKSWEFRGGGNREYSNSFWQDENILELDNGD